MPKRVYKNKDEAYEAVKAANRRQIREKAAAGQEIGPPPPVANPEHRAKFERDLRGWIEHYTPEAVYLGWSDDHLELLESLETCLLYGSQLAVGMPRGTGKTTLVILSIVWAIVYGHHKFIVLVAATEPKAAKALKAIKHQFETNDRLLADFPEVCFPIRALENMILRAKGQKINGKPTAMSWGKQEAVFPTVEGSPSSGSLVIVGGITGAVARGPQHVLDDGTIIRPTCCLIDDFQTRESAMSPVQVQTRLDIIEADLAGMAGPDQSLTMLATVTVVYPDDGADQLLDHDKHPNWNGIRKKFLLSMPSKKAMRLWEEYRDIRRHSLRTYKDIRQATEFYRKNQAAMDEGAEVSWEARFRKVTREVDGVEIDVKEISAIQHAMEWYLVKPKEFASELQNDPQSKETNNKGWLTAKGIERKTHPTSRGVVPQLDLTTHKLFAHIDVHDDLLYWSVGAMETSGSTAIIEYDTYPKQRSVYFQKAQAVSTMLTEHKALGSDGAVRHSLTKLTKDLLDRNWIGEDGSTPYRIDLIGIDCGYNWQLVQNVVMELDRLPEYRHRVIMSRGFGINAADRPFHERSNPKGTELGNAVMVRPPKTKNEAKRLDIDTNYWKTEAQDRWATPLGTTGSLTMFQRNPDHRQADHQLYAEHQKAESGVETFGKGRTVYQFHKLPGDNHYLDNVVAILAMGSLRGCDTPANAQPQVVRKRRKRRSVSYL